MNDNTTDMEGLNSHRFAMTTSSMEISSSKPETAEPMDDFSQNNNMEEYLWMKNREFVDTIAPTLAYLTIAMVAGLIGNSVVFTVYYKRFNAQATRTYILALSACNLLNDLLVIPTEIATLSVRYSFKAAGPCRMIVAVHGFLVPLSAFLLVAVAVDRYRRICRSTGGNEASWCKGAQRCVVLCVTLAFIYTVPSTVLHGPKAVPVSVTGRENVTGFTCFAVDNAFAGSLFPVIFDNATIAILALTIMVIVTCYALIGRHLWLHRRSQLKSTPPADDHGMSGDWNPSQTGEFCTETELSGIVFGQSETTEAAAEQNPVSKDDCSSPSIERLQPLVKERKQTEADTRGRRIFSVRNEMRGVQSGLACHITPTERHGDKSSAVGFNSNTPSNGGDSHPTTHQDLDNVNTTSSVVKLNDKTVDGNRTDHCDADKPTDHSDAGTFDHEFCGGTNSGTFPAFGGRQSLLKTPSTNETTIWTTLSTHRCRCCRRVLPVCWPASCLCPRPCRCPRQTDSQRVPSRPTDACTRGRQASIPRRTTLLLFVLTALYILTYLPRDVIILTGHGKYMSRGAHEQGGWYFNFKHILFRCWAINGAVSPLVYGFCSFRFRQECRRLFARR